MCARVLAATAADAGTVAADTAAVDTAAADHVVLALHVGALVADIVFVRTFRKGALSGRACPSSLGGAGTQL